MSLVGTCKGKEIIGLHLRVFPLSWLIYLTWYFFPSLKFPITFPIICQKYLGFIYWQILNKAWIWWDSGSQHSHTRPFGIVKGDTGRCKLCSPFLLEPNNLHFIIFILHPSMKLQTRLGAKCLDLSSSCVTHQLGVLDKCLRFQAQCTNLSHRAGESTLTHL